MISSGFTLFLIGGLGGLKSKHESVCFKRIGEFTWRVSDCEELVGLNLYGMMRASEKVS